MLYKKFGGDNFPAQMVGEAKLRQLEGVDAPYLSARGPGFVARKRGDHREVHLEDEPLALPKGAIQYAVIGSAEHSFAGVTLSTTFKKKKLWTGEYIGRGKTFSCVLPQLRLHNRSSTTRPMYEAQKPGALYFRSLFKTEIEAGFYIQADTRIIARAELPWDISQGNYGQPPIAGGSVTWEDAMNVRSTLYPAFWSGRTVFVGWVGNWQVYATPNTIWDGSADATGAYRGKAVIDITIYHAKASAEAFQHRVELQFPQGLAEANEVAGTITVLRPGVFVVLAGQSLVNQNGKDTTDGQMALWHNTITVENEGEDWFVSLQANKLRETENTLWSTTDPRYDKSKFIYRAARLASQSPGVLCSDGQSILYAISSPWFEMMDENIVRGSRDFGVAYVRVGVDGVIHSGAITTPEILKAHTVTKDADGVAIALYRNKASGSMPACDLLYCGQRPRTAGDAPDSLRGVILCRVREFVSQEVVVPSSGASHSWPINNAPPLPRFNRVELWRTQDDGRSWEKLPDGIGLPDGLNVANIGLPSVVDMQEQGLAQLVVPVRDREDGPIRLARSKDAGLSWKKLGGGYPSIVNDPAANGGTGVDLFALRGGGLVNAGDAHLFLNIGTDVLHSYSGEQPPIVGARPGYQVAGDISGTVIVNRLYPAYDKALKEVVRVKMGRKDAPKDLVRPWIYDSAYQKPEQE